MKKMFLIPVGIVFCFFLSNANIMFAEEGYSSDDLNDEIFSDKKELDQELLESRENAREAKAEEQELRRQLQDAIASGDTEKANQIRGQLKSMHRQNVQEKQGDKKDINEARKELQQDLGAHNRDNDNNPPGPAGGPGTNWENPPGPKGGPGASPNRKPAIRR